MPISPCPRPQNKSTVKVVFGSESFLIGVRDNRRIIEPLEISYFIFWGPTEPPSPELWEKCEIRKR